MSGWVEVGKTSDLSEGSLKEVKASEIDAAAEVISKAVAVLS